MKTVYVSLIADLLHAGHIKILREASKHGEVTVGLLTSTAITELGDIAYLKYQQRLEVLEDLKMVSKVIAQDTASYKKNLLELKPDFVVHGDDWVNGPQSQYREEALALLKEWGGKLIEVEYSAEISDQNVKNQLMALGITSVTRMQRLKQLVLNKEILLVLEAHNALSALITENTIVDRKGKKVSFDCIWSSSLTDSTSKGKPDIEAVDITSRLNTVNEIFEVTTKPMIFDGDTGGKIEHFEFTVKSLERTGVSAVVIEDKTGLKKNSLFGTDVEQTQDSIENFCQKIKAGKAAQISDDFMIFARIESLILDAGMDDALIRAKEYMKAGADGIMIHSRKKDPTEIIEFMSKFRKDDTTTPVIVVPSSFNSVTVEEFVKLGVNIVIYANHMLRAAYPAMSEVAKSILTNARSEEAEPKCMPIKDILEFIPGTK
ncbi:MAG: phosphoenolpyruvate mutase [Candidatus Marinimicrobia bacterium]|nr:phosphoenolpyruvate mutase [Candidatus Neomarinimicrobiota bacterium]|tara:strand:+ start:270 stop:1568 length:1299 start_codon:yes stop_codon:yes gene_type:complete